MARVRKTATPSFLPTLVVGILLGALGFAAATGSFGQRQDEGETFFEAIDSLPTDTAVPKSNYEWFHASVGSLPEGLVQSSIIATTVQGEIAELTQDGDRVRIRSKYYYVGDPGFYEYAGRITLRQEDGSTTPLLFSPKRMETMRVVRAAGSREIPMSFSDLKVGDRVEITETVDLARSNINDENLVSLTVRVLQ